MTVTSGHNTEPTAPSPVHSEVDNSQLWSVSSVGEATPDVLSPLRWSVWAPALDQNAY